MNEGIYSMNERIYNLAFLKSHDIIIFADRDHRIKDVNPTAIQTFGYSKEAFLSMDLSQLFYDQKEGVRFLKDISISNHVVHWEFDFKNGTGEPFPVLLNADQIDEESGIFMVVAQNLKVMQDEIKARRTRSEMMLLGKLGQTLSHDIRNPLNNIFLGMNQFRSLLGDKQDEDMGFYLNYLDRNILRIKEIVDKFLSPQALFKLNKRSVDLNQLVQDAVKANEDKINNSKIILNLDLSDKPLLFELDPEMMLMALNNLIKNAMESVTENEGVVYIKTGNKSDRASLMISDNGHGISKENLKRIFDPYFSTKTNGMGLGLVNTEQIMTAHGIEMDVQSEVGRGSTFTLYF